MYFVLGKQSFTNQAKGKTYFIIHYAYSRDGVEGKAVKDRFVSEEIFSQVEINKYYQFQFDEGFDGSARLVGVREIVHNS